MFGQHDGQRPGAFRAHRGDDGGGFSFGHPAHHLDEDIHVQRIENAGGQCLAVEQTGFDNVSNGAALQMQTCSTARSQQWTLGVSGAIVSANALCIDVDVAQYYGQGGKVQTWACNNSAQQTWALNNPGQITNWVYDASITTRGKLTSESIGPVGTTPLQTKRYY